MVNKTNILLVNPACLDKRITDDDARRVPIGLYYIGALLLENKFATTLINLADIDKNPIELFENAVRKENPTIIGFSVMNPNRFNAMACAKAAKKILPNVTIVFGGPAATFLCDHLFEACPQIDFMVTGEGEITFLELVKALENKETMSVENISGLVFKQEKKIIKTPLRRPVEPLDDLPHPSRHFTFQHLAMSRGCPGKCTFCGSPKFWGKQGVRFHSPGWLALEIENLVQKGIHHFFLSDDTFTMDKQRVIEFCRILIEKKLTVTWNAISRVDYIDEDLLFFMRKAGCIQLSFGVESGSENIRKILGKPIDQEKIIRAFSLTTSYGILPRAYFIYGSPAETDQTIQESIALMNRIHPLSAIFYMLVIFPGTHLYQSAKQQHRVDDTVWYREIEDLPWFEVDNHLDFKTVKAFGDQLRSEFYSRLDKYALNAYLVDIKELWPFHADFLSRLALTFSHGEYAKDTRVKHQDKTAKKLFEKALCYAPDARAFLGLAMLFQKERQFDKAVIVLEKGLTHHPENKDLNICMGICLMNTGRFAEALKVLKKFGQFPEAARFINICHQHIKGQGHER